MESGVLPKILIVEDEYINRELLNIYLKDEYILTFAHDLEKAILNIDKIIFDLVITDIRLGASDDGLRLLEYIRKGTPNTHTPVYAYTASDASSNQKSFVDEGFDGFITKPVFKDQMRNIVAEALMINSK